MTPACTTTHRTSPWCTGPRRSTCTPSTSILLNCCRTAPVDAAAGFLFCCLSRLCCLLCVAFEVVLLLTMCGSLCNGFNWISLCVYEQQCAVIYVKRWLGGGAEVDVMRRVKRKTRATVLGAEDSSARCAPNRPNQAVPSESFCRCQSVRPPCASG